MGELAASIAHELNQPLSGITSNAAAGQRFIDRGMSIFANFTICSVTSSLMGAAPAM
jgi:C4-dicarboxylate-specific signal transduction histidine kinase